MQNKEVHLTHLIIGLLSVALGYWMYPYIATDLSGKYPIVGIFILTLIIGMFIYLRKLKFDKDGLPIEDEFTIKVRMKTGEMAFGISIFLWLAIQIFSINRSANTVVLIGIGLVLMLIVYEVLFFYYSKKGVGNENPH